MEPEARQVHSEVEARCSNNVCGISQENIANTEWKMPVEKELLMPVLRFPRRFSRRPPTYRRRSRHHLLCSREYKRLRAMVPAIATKPKVSKVTVIEETIKYIDELHSALLLRLQTKGLPQALRGLINTQDIQHLSHTQLREVVQHMMPLNHSESLYPPPPPVAPICQRNRRSASFRIKNLRLKKSAH